MDKLTKQEQDKYIQAWQMGAEGESRTAPYIAQFVINYIQNNHRILDLGCGNGSIVNILRNKGFDAYGVDISSHQFNNSPYLIQGCLWDLPFEDNTFDVTFSTDVLEHIPPEMINKTIAEIYRITKIKTLHCIATFKDNRKGFVFHLIIQSIEWWKQQFITMNSKNIEIEIIDRTLFLKTVIPNYSGK
jgi:ubiquinone/menaquinone biosynthesis C-methylase UbiE